MSKRIVKDDGVYRMRRGKLVRIPDEWVGQTVHPQTIRKRASKQTRQKRAVTVRAWFRRGGTRRNPVVYKRPSASADYQQD